jgi:GNAT superfamily N-acetyltransferase
MERATPFFRQAGESDREFCWRLLGQTMREYVDATWGWDEAVQRRMFDESFDPGAIRIIEADGKPIGMLKVDTDSVPVRLLSIQIQPAHQGRGYGTAVISHVLREAGLAAGTEGESREGSVRAPGIQRRW